MTISRLAVFTTAVLLAASLPAGSAGTAPAAPTPRPGASYAGLQYIGGHTGLPKKVKGTLVVEPTALRFLDKRKRPLFTLAIDPRTSASRSEGCQKSLAYTAFLVLTFPFWGAFMGMGMADPPSFSLPVYFMNVHSETSSGSENVTFKCAKSTCDVISSRINSYAAQAKALQ
jgi:hypothetical protein